MKTMFLTAVAVWMVACSGQTSGPGAEGGGEQQVELKRQAANAASPPAADVCVENDWYGDGACDMFCGDRDVDCSVKDVVCLAYIEEPNGVCEREPGDPCVGQDPDCSALNDPFECPAIAMAQDGICETDPKNPCLRYQDVDCADAGATTPSEPTDPGNGSSIPSDPGNGGSIPSDPGNGGSIPGDPGNGGSIPGDPGSGNEPVACTLISELPNGVCSRDPQDPCMFQDPDCIVK